MLANVSGTSLHVVTVGGAFGRDLSAKGDAAMLDFAVQWIANLFGTDVKRLIKKSLVTRWNAQEYVGGAMSVAGPGHADARKVLMEPVGRIWLAGEAVHESKWGTVEGAWESDVRAAEGVLAQLGRKSGEQRGAPSKQRKR
jgi:monoamine oxidase